MVWPQELESWQIVMGVGLIFISIVFGIQDFIAKRKKKR